MKKLLPIITVILFTIPSIFPLFQAGYFPMHDDTQVARVVEMGRALLEGQFPVRWVSNLGYGYGYPIFNFYGPLPYYFGGFLYAVGVPALVATKLMMGIGVVVPAITLYCVLTAFLGWQAGLISSVLYLYAPYHAVQIYVRGAVGEYWTLIFWPLVLYGVLRQQIVIGSFGLAGAILSHTLMGFVTVIFTAVGIATHWIIMKRIRTRHIVMVLMGLGLSSFFWLPALLEMAYTSVSGQVSETANFRDHFVCISQLWSSLWGYGGSAIGCVDGMSFMLGKVHILLSFVSVVTWLFVGTKMNNAVVATGAMLGLVGIVFATKISEGIWNILPGFSYLQYPWRFLSIAGLGLSIIGGSGIALVRHKRTQSVVAIFLALCVIILNGKWFTPQYTYEKSNREFESDKEIRFRVSKISDEYLPLQVVRPATESEAMFDTIQRDDGVAVSVLEESATLGRYMVESPNASSIVIRKAYFPGWRYRINNRVIKPKIEGGLPTFPISAGQSFIELAFADTPVRAVGNALSVMSILLLGVLVYDKQRQAKR